MRTTNKALSLEKANDGLANTGKEAKNIKMKRPVAQINVRIGY